MYPRTLWRRFRQLPIGMQILIVGGLLWFPALASGGGDDNEPAAADGDVTEAAEIPSSDAEESPSPEDEPSTSPSLSPTASPSPWPSPASTPSPSPSPTAEALEGWTVTNIVDGDTVDVMAADGTFERVRLIGIDTPERGECGFTEASDELAILILHEQVELVAGARDDRDRYDRLLRYIDVDDGLDAGLVLIEEGLAIARYDSRDGYGRHPREDEYVAADAATPHVCAGTAAPASPTESEAAPPPPPSGSGDDTTASNPWGSASCDPAYDPCVPPTSEVGDLDCPDIKEHYSGGVAVDHAHGDAHRLDGDKDGRGCE